ncbi:hypothetical protein L7F22_052154 [Adiantum nelumboides]|nr:hypothetical protein [Adiantum nelumboides]
MAFTAGQQLLGPALCSADLQDTLQSHGISIITPLERVVCLSSKQLAVKKGRSKASSPSTSSSSPSLLSSVPPSLAPSQTSTLLKDLKESLIASGLSACQKGHALPDRDYDIALSMQSWPEVEGLLTELRRSLLETQWALTSEPEVRPCNVEVDEKAHLVKSTRPSARERRLHCRKSMEVMGPVKCEKKSHIEEALASVSTLGLKGRRELLSKEEEVILAKKMKVGYNLRAARATLAKMLGHEPSDDVWASSVNLTFLQVQRKILEADRARDQMFVSNLRLVFSVANKYTGLGVTLSDLIQEGALGLLRGLEKFNHKKGFKLSTYVHWWIRQGITRALADHSRTVRLPSHMHERLNTINKAAASLRLEGMSVSLKSLSQAVNLPDEMVAVALKSTKKMVSLDKTKRWGDFGSETETLHNYIADTRSESDPWIAVDEICMREDVDYLMKKILNKREREIVRLHYGLDRPDGMGLSLEKISHRYGISRERTRQVEGCALRKLAASGLSTNLDVPLA